MDNAELLKIIDLAVQWGPTLIFVLILLGYAFTGFRRGFRKSMILYIHSLIAGAICISLYFILVNTVIGDQMLLTLINAVLGDESALQNQLGVETSADRLTLVLVDFISVQNGFGDSVTIIIKDNGAYLATLVNLLYHIAFALVLGIVYLILVFLLFIIYGLFYSDKAHAKRVLKKFQRGKADGTFRKRRFSGALIGMLRGTVTGLFVVSLLGSVLYVATGGRGEERLPDRDFGNVDYNLYYNAYQSIGTYGTNGIIQVLNVVQDQDEVPYYLYLADIILQGNYTEESIEGMIKEEHSIVVREELSTYTTFLLNAIDVVFKYKEDVVMGYIKGEVSEEDLMNELTLLFAEAEFQYDFSKLINSFNDDTYIFNLALSLVDTIVKNVDSPEMAINLTEESKEMIKVFFASDYYCPSIPEEQKMLELGYEVDLPHIKPSNLLTKEDVNIILSMVFAMMKINPENSMYMIESVISFVKQLSIFDGNRKDEMNPALARFYTYIENVFLSNEVTFEQEEINNLSVKEKDPEVEEYIELLNNTKIDWIGEIEILLDLVGDIVTFSEKFTQAETENPLDVIVSIFDQENPDYEQNYALYKKLKDALVDSQILGEVLSTKTITSLLFNTFRQIAPNYTMPSNVIYANQYDEEGNLVATGELYNLLSCIEALVTSGKLDVIIDSAQNGITGLEDIKEFLVVLNEKDSSGYSAVDYVFESQIFGSVISSFVLEISNTENSLIYVPEKAKVILPDGTRADIIDNAYLKEALVNLPMLLDEIEPLLNGEEVDIIDIFSGPAFTNMKENPLVQGIIVNQIVLLLKDNEVIILPEKLKKVDNWLVGEVNEFDRLFNALVTLDVDFNNVDPNQILETIKDLSVEEIDSIISSSVIHYTISNLIINNGFGDFLIIPNTCKSMLTNDTLDEVIKKNALLSLMDSLRILLDLDLENIDPNELITLVIKNKDKLLTNDIIKATLVSIINSSLSGTVDIPEHLRNAASTDMLRQYSSSNPWDVEIPAVLSALDEVFSISKGDSFDLSDDLQGKIYDILLNYDVLSEVIPDETKFGVILKSQIISYNLTKVLDQVLTDDIIDSKIKNLAKINDSYNKEEMISLCEVLKLYGLLNEEEFGNFDLTTLEVKEELIDMFRNERSLYLIRGILTKQISKIFSGGDVGLKSHPKAYDSNKNQVLKHQEIISILEITKSIGFDTTSFDSEEIELGQYLKYIKDKNGLCKSYLLVATISSFIYSQSDSMGLIIPSSIIYETTNIIDHEELYKLLSFLNTVFDGGKLGEINIVSTFKLKAELFESKILNATFVRMLSVGDDLELYAPTAEVTADKNAKDLNQTVYFLKETGYENLVNAILHGFGDLSIGENNMTYDYVKSLDDKTIKAMLESGIIRIAISDVLKEKYDTLPGYVKTQLANEGLSLHDEQVFHISSSTGGKVSKKTFAKNDILSVLEALRQIEGAL